MTPGPADRRDRRPRAEREQRGGRRSPRAAGSLGGGEPGATVALATGVTGGGAAADSTGGGVPRWDGQRGAAGAKRRARRAGGARPALPGVEHPRPSSEMTRGHFDVRGEHMQVTAPSLFSHLEDSCT